MTNKERWARVIDDALADSDEVFETTDEDEKITALFEMADDYRALERIQIHKGVSSITIENLPEGLVEGFEALMMDAVESEKRNARNRMVFALKEWSQKDALH